MLVIGDVVYEVLVVSKPGISLFDIKIFVYTRTLLVFQ